MQYYTEVLWISMGVLAIFAILIRENARMGLEEKKEYYKMDLMIAIACISEWLGVFMNGMDPSLIRLHAAVKCLDYVFTPMIGIFIVRSFMKKRETERPIWAILAINAAVQITSVFTGWTFYIDEANYYHHGPSYLGYELLYCGILAYVALSLILYGRKFRNHNFASGVAIVVLSLVGIGIQEFNHNGARTAAMSLVFGMILLYLHNSEFFMLETDLDIDNKDKMIQKGKSAMDRQKRMLETDTLTGLFSRHAYNNDLNELNAEGELPSNFAVAIIDINRLKYINDQFGHAVGDELIQGAAECVRKVFGARGRCYRTGGDEFVILFSDITSAKMTECHRNLMAETQNWTCSEEVNLALAAGYAYHCDYPNMTAEELVRIADREMYEEKERYYRVTGLERRK